MCLNAYSACLKLSKNIGEPNLEDLSYLGPFDICYPTISRPRSPRPMTGRRDYSNEECRVIQPGMILLKNFLTLDEQIAIVDECRTLGKGNGGFYIPEYASGSRMKLHMMCLGRDWDPQTRTYQKIRLKDGAQTPKIPEIFRTIVKEAVDTAQQLEANPIPDVNTDVCIVNFYEKGGRLGLHQDRDETTESITRGIPVISFSIGDDAEFLYGEQKRMDLASKLILRSGDVLIFGGESRLVYHGIKSVKLNTAPPPLVNATHIRPGRLNLTFREF